MIFSFREIKKPPIPPNRGFSRNKKAADLAGSAALVFVVNPSKTPSSSPGAYEYYDANNEKQAVRRCLIHDPFLPVHNCGRNLPESQIIVKRIFFKVFFKFLAGVCLACPKCTKWENRRGHALLVDIGPILF